MILKIFVVALIMAITIASGDDKIPTNRAVNSPIVVLKFWKIKYWKTDSYFIL